LRTSARGAQANGGWRIGKGNRFASLRLWATAWPGRNFRI
jgi:hypothetical protein